MTSKDELEEIESAIRRVLMEKWDPIGVSDEPQAADEYDSYIWGIYGLLKRGAEDKEIATHLLKIETERMGLTDTQGRPLSHSHARDEAVAALRRLRIPIAAAKEPTPRRGFRHWKLFSKFVSPAFAKTQARRQRGLCIGCGSNPCICKNPKKSRS